MEALVHAADWGATPLGSMASWPHSLRTAARILLTSRFAMWMGWGPELTFLYNDAYARMTLGKKHPWALGRPAREVWAEIWDDIGPRIETVLHTGTATWDETLQLFLERGGYREETYHTFSYSPLADDAGQVAGMFCVVMEETERVIGERRLATLRELASALALTIDEGEVLEVVERVVGANPQDLPFTLVYLFDDDAAAGGAGRARLAGATGIAAGHPAAPARILADDGDAAPWPASGIVAGTTLVLDLATRLGAVVGELPTGAWATPPMHAVVAPIPGHGQDDPVGFLVAAVNPHRVLDESYRGFVALVAGQIAASLASARAYESERKRAAALAELDRAKTQFFSNVSHEFRTPLTLMLGPAEDTLADGRTTDANRERAAVIHRNAQRLLRLVNTMLDFSRIEAGRVEATYQPTDVAAYTRDLASSFRSAVERAGLRLVVDASPLDFAPPVYVDHDMWEKIVLNLLSNAFKHTFDGEIAVRVTARGGHVEMAVSDTGVGIPSDQLPRLFERFHRVPNARSRTHEGTGIGLALVQELVRLHGGTIVVESVVGRGTTFTVSLPVGATHLPADRVAASDPTLPPAAPRHAIGIGIAAYVEEATRWLPATRADAPATSATDAGDAPAAQMRGRIVVADDNTDMREYVTRLLRERGWDVEPVADGAAALAAARAQVPDLVLSDVMMPGLDGFALIEALRTTPETRAVPVVLLSARAGEEARVEGMSAGAADYLVKPFSARELVARVESQLERAHVHRHVSESEARFRNMADHAPVMLWVSEPDGSCSFLNRQWYAYTGQTPETGLDDGWLDALHPDDREASEATFREATVRRTPFRMGYRLRRADGEYRRMVDASAPRFGSNGEFLGYIGSVVDVEERARLLEAERRAREEAERANRAKSEFLAAMSHELRTPLNAIAGYTQLIDLGVHGPVTDAQHQALERVQRSQQHLLSLINDVLNFAKLEAGRVEYALTDVPVADAVAEVVPMLEPQLSAKGLRWDVRVAPGLVARADREKLGQILLNLLANAVKFTEAGGRISIHADTEASSEAITLAVSDTGVGVPAEKLEAIFEPFVQVHTGLASARTGTGLGLAISRDLARGMGGDLTVASTPGDGSTFTLTLRRA